MCIWKHSSSLVVSFYSVYQRLRKKTQPSYMSADWTDFLNWNRIDKSVGHKRTLSSQQIYLKLAKDTTGFKFGTAHFLSIYPILYEHIYIYIFLRYLVQFVVQKKTLMQTPEKNLIKEWLVEFDEHKCAECQVTFTFGIVRLGYWSGKMPIKRPSHMIKVTSYNINSSEKKLKWKLEHWKYN